MNEIGISVHTVPEINGAVAFTRDFSKVFRESSDIAPVPIDHSHSYMPWGADNKMPFDVMDLFERDETMSTCSLFNREICYGDGLIYDAPDIKKSKRKDIDDFFINSNMPDYFLGICADIKMFEFAVSVINLSDDGRRVISISRREACYCRFSVADKAGHIPFVYYADWRASSIPAAIEAIPVLPRLGALEALRKMAKAGKRKFAVIARMPSVDFAYYPIPYYASLIRGKWYNIKQLIAAAKEAKLRNSAPLKYHIEVAQSFWNRLVEAEGITDPNKQLERIDLEKQNMIDFLTGAENAGKVIFSQFYMTPDGRENHDVKINKIDTDKEGGDWATDLQEAINVICFTMRVHSNLVGSVPGKSQSNNSGSDKRELHTITQASQKPWRDVLFAVHKIVIAFNGWEPAVPACPFMQLTTLDEHASAKKVSQE